MDYLAQSRWPDGFQCPKCGGKKYWIVLKPFGYECAACGRRTSPTAGTVLHSSHIRLQDWFWAAYLVSTVTPGMSALQLRRQLGASYKTAWFMLHRLRRAMVNDYRTLLHGRVEADETIIGGPVKGKCGRGINKEEANTLVFGAVEVEEYRDSQGRAREKSGRLRLAITERADSKSIRQFMLNNVQAGTTVSTDGWQGYSRTAMEGYLHAPEIKAMALHIHHAFGNLKTWLNGTHHGVDPKYLQTYLNEFVFRFNRRHSPMAAFQTLLGIAAAKKPVSLRNLTRP